MVSEEGSHRKVCREQDIKEFLKYPNRSCSCFGERRCCAVGLTENPSALCRWMVSGPEITRIVNEFENSMVTITGFTQAEHSAKHHEDTRSLQSLFYRDVTALTRAIEVMDNPYQPLSQDDKLHLPQKKWEQAECLQSFTTPQAKMPEAVDGIIIDSSVVVNMIKPVTEKTFAEYSEQCFLPYIQSQLSHAKRLDVVSDDYIAKSFKAMTRSKRGHGARRCVQATSQIPRNWQQFLRSDKNKRELFQFLAQDVASPQLKARKSYAVQEGHRKIVLQTVNTDVLVLATALAGRLQEQQVEVWVSMGTASHLRYIAALEISNSLGLNISKSLPVFHAFTGCDTVSFFTRRGKKTAFTVWKSYPAITDAFLQLPTTPAPLVSEACMAHLEWFVILLYDRTSNKANVNEARKQLFPQKGRAYDAIPPTRAALLQHTKRAAYQARHCWDKALTPNPNIPFPGDLGWIFKEGEWQPFWTTLLDVTKSCRELLRCGCKLGCRGRCCCERAALKCTALCSCCDVCNNG
ncbi:hypothetical protein ACROYT_G043662 [Oculina patagonica]